MKCIERVIFEIQPTSRFHGYINVHGCMWVCVCERVKTPFLIIIIYIKGFVQSNDSSKNIHSLWKCTHQIWVLQHQFAIYTLFIYKMVTLCMSVVSCHLFFSSRTYCSDKLAILLNLIISMLFLKFVTSKRIQAKRSINWFDV